VGGFGQAAGIAEIEIPGHKHQSPSLGRGDSGHGTVVQAFLDSSDIRRIETADATGDSVHRLAFGVSRKETRIRTTSVARQQWDASADRIRPET
jgi:hypothetical protein